MKLRMAFLALLALTTVFWGCDQTGKPTKMAVINTKEVITKCNIGIRTVEEVQRQFDDRQNELKKQEQAIQKLREDPAVSDPKSGKKEALQNLAQKFVDESQRLRKDVADTEAVKFKPVVDKINKVLAEYAKEHGLAGVQDKNGFAYIDPSIDITEEIIKKIDQLP
ncbi:MAG: OmpH family outer membrane protein [Solidesulfovibrio sp.]